MEPWVLLVLLIVGVPIVIGIWLIVRAVDAKHRLDELSRRVRTLETDLREAQERAARAAVPEATAPKSPAAPQPAVAPLPDVVRKPVAPKPEILPHLPPMTPVTKAPAPPFGSPLPEPVLRASVAPEPAVTPPPLPILPVPAEAYPAAQPTASAINWEQFMGVKGFAWIGGFALFLGVVFFIKYAFDQNLISPELRMGIGFFVGLCLLVGGVVMSRKNLSALSQTLCATGVLVLYAVTFSCRALYHFPFFGAVPTFLLMALITVAAFLIAVRLNAMVVAILGMLGGFLTPVLISTGQDNPLGLFGYIAVLDTGLLLVALNRRWDFLATLAATGTAFMEMAWVEEFFVREKYFVGNKIFVTLAVLVGFNALFLLANWLAKRRAQSNWWLTGGQLGLAAVALAYTPFFFGFAPLARQPVVLFGFVFLVDLAVAALAWIDRRAAPAQTIAGLAVFGLMAAWTLDHLTNGLLNAALAFYLLFAVFHAALPAWQRRQKGAAFNGTAAGSHFFPPLALLLVLLCIFKLEALSFLVWPFVLLVDLLAIALAVATATLAPVLAVLVLTLAATGALIFKIPEDLTGLPTSFFLLGAFAVFFVAASVWLVRRFKPDAFKVGLGMPGESLAPESVAAFLPACSAVLPFLLLIMATLRLGLANPSPIFGLALLLAVLMLGLTKLFALDWMPTVGLLSVFAVECAWHFSCFDPPSPRAHPPVIVPTELLGWYLLFFVLFAVFPFVFLRKFAGTSGPWAAAALAGPGQFLLVYRLVKITWPNQVMGLLPAVFTLPALLSLVILLKKAPADSKARMAQLAWFGGVALFFITLIFPIQFDREWITIGWALEGAALLWLLHRVPHEGLRLTGLGLLAAAFARLACNPAVLEYHARSTTPILNWYLYTYGIVTVALFIGSRLLAPPRHLVMQTNARALLASLGTVLAFLLLNIEIADYFSAPGSTLTFQFSGNFARDMSYSIAWALFALGLLVFGITKNSPAARYTAMGLLCATLLKLFLHDLAQLAELYRIGAFVGVAIAAMLASFAYLKFFAAAAKPAEAKK
jgi:uncharacterized membrane protein